LNDIHLRQAKQHGVKIVINTDSHHTSHLDKIRYGILQARRAWLTRDDVLNTLPADKFAKAVSTDGKAPVPEQTPCDQVTPHVTPCTGRQGPEPSF